jgi:hypothetical protein
LRTTPARKPRTECCCQPVAFIIAAIVVPVGNWSIAITRDCFEPESTLGLFTLPVVDGAGFAAGTGVVDDTTGRFFADFDIETLHSVQGGVTPHHRSPISANKPAGQDL